MFLWKKKLVRANKTFKKNSLEKIKNKKQISKTKRLLWEVFVDLKITKPLRKKLNTIVDKIFGTKQRNPVKLDSLRKV